MNQPNNFSLLLLTHNESKNIQENFNWLEKCPGINEIIVVDDNSTDDTLKVLEKLKIKNLPAGRQGCKLKIYSRGLDNNFSAQRNFGISKTSNNWILWLDADEKPSKEFINFINDFDFNQKKVFAFKREDIFLGHVLKHGETANIYFPRIFNKKYGKFEGMVHETWVSSQPIQKENISIIHNSHQTLNSFLKKINFYTDIRARELYEQKVKVNLFEIIFYPIGKFIQNYFLRLGFLDSTPGIIMALSMSFHSFLVRAKLWHLSQK